jgi:hypothetical protein
MPVQRISSSRRLYGHRPPPAAEIPYPCDDEVITMTNRTPRALAAVAFAAVFGAALVSGASPVSAVEHRVATPNECIRVNGGDWTACNVGNSGRGDLPYLPVQ